jgi:hypothetical protein
MIGSYGWPRRLLFGLGIIGAWFAHQALAQSDTAAERPMPVSEGPAEPSSGLIACIDPQTGQLVSPEGNPNCTLPPSPPSAAAEAPLVEEPLEGGGFKVNLQGRSQTPPTTTGGQQEKLTPEPQTPPEIK